MCIPTQKTLYIFSETQQNPTILNFCTDKLNQSAIDLISIRRLKKKIKMSLCSSLTYYTLANSKSYLAQLLLAFQEQLWQLLFWQRLQNRRHLRAELAYSHFLPLHISTKDQYKINKSVSRGSLTEKTELPKTTKI